VRFKGKVVIISGGGAGIGRAAALAFAREGAYVVINDLYEKNLNETANLIRSIGATVTEVQGDVTLSESIKTIVRKTLEQYGKIDILFNHVGGNPNYAPMSLFIEQNEAYWDRSIELNLKSTILLCRAVLDSMMKQKYGKIINLAAAAGREGATGMVIYSAVKGGVIAFTKALAKEVGAHGINVNCVAPGGIDTPGRAKVLGKFYDDETTKQSIISKLPIPRDGRSEDIANTVLFLASDESAYITGQTIAVDGGMTMV
jgi:NAD(P)-dependent dehydrogenase (short-subunit alcohol dehydrogenase family)